MLFSSAFQSKILLITLQLIFLSVNHSSESIFSSLIRNNLNRYLKNPLFTKSFVKNSIWQGEPEDGGGFSPLMAPGPHFLSAGSNKFPAEHILDAPPYGQFNFEISRLNNDQFSTKIMPPSMVKSPLDGSKPFQAKDKVDDLSFMLKSSINTSESRNHNGKSMQVSSSNVNAYSDSRRINSLNHKNKPVQSTNSYVNDDSMNLAESISRAIQQPTYKHNRSQQNRNQYRNGHQHNGKKMKDNHGKYNQEKALNLKLEYGFKPLPNAGRNPIIPSNSIHDPHDDDQDGEDNTNDNKENHSLNFFNGLFNRSMKSLNEMNNNRLDSDQPFLSSPQESYKKYISYPMETESSDVHKLAFTGVESFRPDHSDMTYKPYGLAETLANYPNIKNFKQQGIDCARNNGFCEYDSSYPIDYINSIITNCTSILDDMYTEMPENMNDFNGYRSLFQIGSLNANHHDQNNATLCDSDRKYIRPSVIKDIQEEYHLILQSSFYFQQIPIEICLKPGSSCNYIGRCHSRVRCQQKYRTHQMISIIHHDPTTDGGQYSFMDNSHGRSIQCPKMRMYRLPSACVCELTNEATTTN